MRWRRGKRCADTTLKVCEHVTEEWIFSVLESQAAGRRIEKRSVGVFNHERSFSG
jgi:hypothetical protein